MISARAATLVTLTALLAVPGCGAPASHTPVVSPVPGAPAPAGPITLALPEVETFRSPSGLTVHLASSPDAMVSHIALRTSPRPLLARPRAGLDPLIAALIADAMNASVSLDRRGLQIDRDSDHGRAAQTAAELLSLGADSSWSASDIAATATNLRAERQQTPSVLQASIVRRLFGANTWEWEIHSPDATIPNPSLDEIRARLAELVHAEGANLVIVSPLSGAELRAQLEASLGTSLAPVGEDAGAPHDMGTSEVGPTMRPSHEPQAPRPQLHAFASSSHRGLVRLTVAGPDTFDPEAGAFEVAMSALGSSAALGALGERPARQSTRWILGRTVATVEVAVTHDDAARVVEVARSELERLVRGERVTARELEVARTAAMAMESARFERPIDLATSVLDAASAGVPLTTYAQRFEAMSGATPEQVALSAQLHLALERVAFTVVASEDDIARIGELPGGQFVMRQRR